MTTPDGWILYNPTYNCTGPYGCFRNQLEAELHWAHLLELPWYANHNIRGVQLCEGSLDLNWTREFGYQNCGVTLEGVAVDPMQPYTPIVRLLDITCGRDRETQMRHTGWVVNPHQYQACRIPIYSDRHVAARHGEPHEVRFSGCPVFINYVTYMCMRWDFGESCQDGRCGITPEHLACQYAFMLHRDVAGWAAKRRESAPPPRSLWQLLKEPAA